MKILQTAIFLVTLFRAWFFIRNLPYSSWFSLIWNLGLLLGLSWASVFSQVLLLDYRWSHNPPTYWRAVIPNWYWTYTVPKFCLQSGWVTGAYCYTRPLRWLSTETNAKLCTNSTWLQHKLWYGLERIVTTQYIRYEDTSNYNLLFMLIHCTLNEVFH